MTWSVGSGDRGGGAPQGGCRSLSPLGGCWVLAGSGMVLRRKRRYCQACVASLFPSPTAEQGPPNPVPARVAGVSAVASGGFPNDAACLGAVLWKGGFTWCPPTRDGCTALTGSAPGRACPGWHLVDLRAFRGRGEPDAGHGAGQERERGQQTRPHCAAPRPPAHPSIAALFSEAAPQPSQPPRPAGAPWEAM